MDDALTKRVGERLRAARNAAGLTQKDVARVLNVRENDIRRWENGKNLPVSSRLPDIAAVLNISLDALFADADEEEPSDAKSGPTSTRKRARRSRLTEPLPN